MPPVKKEQPPVPVEVSKSTTKSSVPTSSSSIVAANTAGSLAKHEYGSVQYDLAVLKAEVEQGIYNLERNLPHLFRDAWLTIERKCEQIRKIKDTGDTKTTEDEETSAPPEYTSEAILERIRTSWSDAFRQDKSPAVRAAAQSLFRLRDNGDCGGDLPVAGTRRFTAAGLAGIVIPEDNEPVASADGLARAACSAITDSRRMRTRSSGPAVDETPSGSGKEPLSEPLGRAPSKRRH